jgi:hypothetical protein
MSLLMSGVGSLLSFVVYGGEVKTVTGELSGKNASSAQVRFVRILFTGILGFRNCAFVVADHISRRDHLERECRIFKIL